MHQLCGMAGKEENTWLTMTNASPPMRSRSELWPLTATAPPAGCPLPDDDLASAALRAARSSTMVCTSAVTGAAAQVSLSSRPA